jgi:hypothetical protein
VGDRWGRFGSDYPLRFPCLRSFASRPRPSSGILFVLADYFCRRFQLSTVPVVGSVYDSWEYALAGSPAGVLRRAFPRVSPACNPGLYVLAALERP